MLMSALLVKASIVIKERERLFLVKMEVNYIRFIELFMYHTETERAL